MARLPDVVDFGARPTGAVARPVATVRNAGAVGQAVQRFGAVVAAEGERRADEEADFELATAQSRLLRASLETEQAIRDEAPYTEWADAYQARIREQAEEIGAGLRDNRSRRAFGIFADNGLARSQARLREQARDRLGSERRAVLGNNLAANIDAAVAVNDPATRTAFLEASAAMIDGLVAENDLDPETAARMKRSLASDFAKRSLTVMDPQARLDELGKVGGLGQYLPPDEIAVIRRRAEEDLRVQRQQDAVARGRQQGAAAAAVLNGDSFRAASVKILGVESAFDPDAKNPNSSALGAGQFIDGTWLDMMQRNRPDLTAGRSDAEILEMRRDPRLALEMTEAYARQNAERLASEGLPVNEATLYLAHFLGPGGAVQALKADDATPVAQIMTPEAIAANLFLSGWTAGELKDWASSKMGGQPATPEAYLARIEDPEERRAAIIEFERMQSLNAGAQRRQRAEMEAQAFAYINDGNSVMDLPMDVQNALGREAMSSLLEYEKKVQAGSAVETDPVLYATLMDQYATDPEAFKAQDPLTWRSRLDDGDWEKMVDLRAKLRGEKPTDPKTIKPRTASALMTAASRRMGAAGIETGAGASDDDRKTAAELQTALLREAQSFIDREGRQMSELELDDTIRRLLTEVTIDPRGPFNEATAPLFQVGGLEVDARDVMGGTLSIGGEEVPPAEIERAAFQFEEINGRAPSPAELVELLVMARERR